MGDLFDLPFDDDEPGEPETELAAPGPRVYSVSQLNAEIRAMLESRYAEVWVEGEISNCRLWNTGHLYFTLKDSSAQLRAVMWRTALRGLKFRPEDGMQVVARGRLGVYEAKGEYQLVCEMIEPRGVGALQVALEQLKKKLGAEGLFEQARKRQLPRLPRKIGIVTSLDGAALRDIIKVLSRRYPNAHLVIAPTRVQGDGAAQEIARALDAVGRIEGVDVVIAGRGGGAIEDLWSFNEETVARAIARSPVPVISAVGHETDVTIADLVADLRAPTPSAAAELVVTARDEFVARIDRLAERARAAGQGLIQQRRIRLERLMSRPAVAGFHGRLALRGRHVAELSFALQRAARGNVERRSRALQALRIRLDGTDLRRQLGRMRARVGQADVGLQTALGKRFHAADLRWRTLAGRLDTLSPLAVLGRGYAVCWNEDRTQVVRRAEAVAPGDTVHVTLHEGSISCEVKDRTTSWT
jgi:exodeoxyribonuclease VII large subunit